MRNKIEKGVDLNLRQFIKSLGYIAGGTALLASTPWLSSCTPEKLKEIRNEKVRAMAFSQNTCLPAARASSTMGACQFNGVEIITPSISADSKSFR